MEQHLGLPFRRALPPLALLSGVFFLNFMSRIMLAPLLPAVEADLGLTHGTAGGFFLFIAVGNAAGLLSSGFVSARMGHHKTIAASALGLGLAATAASLATDMAWFRLALFFIGIGAGVYLPSGIASIMALVRREDWGKSVAVHEMASNAAFVLAPLLAEAVLALAGWRQALLALGLTQVGMGLFFQRFGQGSRAKGSPLSPRVVTSIMGQGQFWLLAMFFCLAAAGSFSPFSMLPLFLTDLGRPRSEVNQLLALSRLLSLGMPFFAGMLVDKAGARPVAGLAFLLNALALAGLSLASGRMLTALVVLQPMVALLFFPAGFTALSHIFCPETRNAAVSLITPMSIMFGIGIIPWVLGHLGDAGHFRAGFLLIAGMILAGALCTRLLNLPKHQSQSQRG